jgi:hypothetical protein
MRLLTLRGALRSPLAARSSEGGNDRLLEVFGGVEPHNGMLGDFSGLGTLEDGSTFGEALSTRGLVGWESALCTALAVGTGMDRGGLRSWLFRRDLELRGADVGLRARREERTGEDSREDRAEFVVEGGAEMPGTAEDSFGSWARTDAWV